MGSRLMGWLPTVALGATWVYIAGLFVVGFLLARTVRRVADAPNEQWLCMRHLPTYDHFGRSGLAKRTLVVVLNAAIWPLALLLSLIYRERPYWLNCPDCR